MLTGPTITAPACESAPAVGDALPPKIIQGGMGIAVSSWRLAKAVAQAGQLGVVSGTALDSVFARRLQDGDQGGHVRRAVEHFPVPEMGQRVLQRYFRPEGREPGQPYIPVPKLSLRPSDRAVELSVLANFAEVWLAKEGHDGLVGINFLEKVQMATPSAAYGALLAGVDYVLMGAGIPTEIPRLLDQLAGHQPCSLTVHVDGASTVYTIDLDPVAVTGPGLAPLRRPQFLAIVSAHVLTTYLARDAVTRPEGFIIEGPVAGGHNAPPRGRMALSEDGQPLYGPRDHADLAKVAEVGLPFWLAGGYNTPERLREALSVGATGVQVGTLFAVCEQSGLDPLLRQETLSQMAAGQLQVRTEPLASPTGFPFKVAELPGTLSESDTYDARKRHCDLSYLRVPYERTPGVVGYRCPSEPVDAYVRKGGRVEDTVGHKCLCNALTGNVELGQTRPDGYYEPPLVTLGADLSGATELLTAHPAGWTASQAVGYLMAADLGLSHGSSETLSRS